METLVLAMGLFAMIPFVTAGVVALAVAAMPVMVVVLSVVETTHHAIERPVRRPLFVPHAPPLHA